LSTPFPADDRPRSARATLQTYLVVLRRRALVVFLTLVTIPALAVIIANREDPRYEALAQVLVRREDIARTLTGTSDPQANQDPQRDLLTQATVASTPGVLDTAATRSGVPKARALQSLGEGSVVPDPDTDILNFRVADTDPSVATRLATAWSQAYSEQTRELRTSALTAAEKNLQSQLNALRDGTSAEQRTVNDLESQLALVRTLISLGTNGAVVLSAPTFAQQVSPSLARAGVSGLLIAAVVAGILAAILELLDTRVRRTEDIAAELGLSGLARLPDTRKRPGAGHTVLMLNIGEHVDRTDHETIEAFRLLRTNVDFATLQDPAPMVMVTSGLPAEGKSTTIANLAAAEARAGRRVALVDLDLRSPVLHQLFGVPLRPGLTDVALDQASLDDATTRFALLEGGAERAEASRSDGLLAVIPAGVQPPDPGDFLATSALGELLNGLRESYDLVLVDSAPMLPVSDAVILSPHMSGIVLITRVATARRPVLRQLRQSLEACASRRLGLVTIGDVPSFPESSYHGYAGGSGGRSLTADRALRQ
jgi:non-specific protein-tyrosine kinase